MMQNKLNALKSWRSLVSVLAIVFVGLLVVSVPVLAQDATPEATPEMTPAGNSLPNIVLVHGAWADGSSWSAVIPKLQADGYNVTAPQFPENTLKDDVARLRQVLNRQKGPTIVVGHSYGGEIMTSLNTDAPNVVGLVYIAAFGLDEGESIGGLLATGAPTPALAHLDVDALGFAWLPEDDFVNHFAADVDPVQAKVMYAAQQPASVTLFGEVMGVPAWKACPPGTWSPPMTRPSRLMPSVLSPSVWEPPPSKSLPVTWRWFHTRMMLSA